MPLVSDLDAEYDVVAYDARGHGLSDAPPTGYSVADRIDDLLGLLEELGLESPVLLGHSTGGNTVMAAGARRPERPHAIVAIDPAGLLDLEPDPKVRERRTRERIEEWHELSVEELLSVEEGLQDLVATGNERLARLLTRARQRVHPRAAAVTRHGFADPEEIYPEIAAPTLVLRADGDERQRERDRTRCARLPNGRLYHVDGAGHTVVRDAREEATRAVLEFLDEVP
ncbi:alpha/beta hydrolase [Halobiforma lacisalsi AJ5]|uniref:Alpha/beta hydrolase n=2 Tax=Natronobacterium lacisalsi AJ5 TaxID=358396 RepID=A0A1P8LU58_NATLA|nr:alpha/beta hydrolase [Halobiforma lacisalsi]APW99333.1 alpha/beta hydrolase [Halobiforma lacisalsi AJ5]